jgi:hypothetical protein
MILNFSHWMNGGGTAMYPLLFLLAPLMVAMGLLHVVVASRRTLLALALALFVISTGGSISTELERNRVRIANSQSHPEEKLVLYARGYNEANRPVKVSLGIMAMGLLPFVVGELRRARRHVHQATPGAQ